MGIPYAVPTLLLEDRWKGHLDCSANVATNLMSIKKNACCSVKRKKSDTREMGHGSWCQRMQLWPYASKLWNGIKRKANLLWRASSMLPLGLSSQVLSVQSSA